MAADFNKRLSQLSHKTDEVVAGQISVVKYALLFLCFLVVFGYVFSYSDNSLKDSSRYPGENLKARIYNSRADLVEDTFLGGKLSETYRRLSDKQMPKKGLDLLSESMPWDNWALFNLESIFDDIFTTSFIRVFFVTLLFWPFWLVSCLIGYYLFRKKQNDPIEQAGVLDVMGFDNKPFYSGLYAPLEPNSSISCTDLSCPGLACPKVAGSLEILKSSLSSTLKTYDAYNATNEELTGIILAYKDYPSFVPLESSIDDNQDNEENLEGEGSFLTNEKGTVLSSAEKNLPVILSAHSSLKKIAKQLFKEENVSYSAVRKELEQVVSQVDPNNKFFLDNLIPSRMKALASLPSSMIASAYLALEAGKALVYDEAADNTFVRKSLYPHLQARAVLHSIESYHKEYKGDGKLIIRQAIVCSRRHGDFGRAFLPTNMPKESRALRDWLEILWAEPGKMQNFAELLELESHIEEIHSKFKSNLKEKLSKKVNSIFPYKCTFLIPLKTLKDAALGDLETQQIERIEILLGKTKELQSHLPVSSRLPGFKREAIEAAKFEEQNSKYLKELRKTEEGRNYLIKWRIIRRVLRRYNWLSTRIGDKSVPKEGFVSLISSVRGRDGEKSLSAFSNLIPVRQRRLEELFGKNWKEEFFPENLGHKNRVFTDQANFQSEMSKNNLELKS